MPSSRSAPPVYFRITFANGATVEDSAPADELGRTDDPTFDAEVYFMKRWAHHPPKGVPSDSEIVKVERIARRS